MPTSAMTQEVSTKVPTQSAFSPAALAAHGLRPRPWKPGLRSGKGGHSACLLLQSCGSHAADLGSTDCFSFSRAGGRGLRAGISNEVPGDGHCWSRDLGVRTSASSIPRGGPGLAKGRVFLGRAGPRSPSALPPTLLPSVLTEQAAECRDKSR